MNKRAIWKAAGVALALVAVVGTLAGGIIGYILQTADDDEEREF